MSVTLRQIEEKDLEQLRDWRNADWLRPYVREYRLLNMVNQHDWFERISRSLTDAMFAIMADDELAGVCGLCNINWKNRTAEVSLYIEIDHQGQHIAIQTLRLLQEKATRDYNLHRLWAEIFAFNEASPGLFEKADFVYEGRMIDHVWKEGHYADSLIYGWIVQD